MKQELKNIPVPTDFDGRKGAKPKYNFHTITPGKCLEIETEKKGNVVSAAYSWNRFHPDRKLLTRSYEKGVRVWLRPKEGE